jgi:NAD-dependent deacetylase
VPKKGAAPDPGLVAQAVSMLRGARRILVVTGAGISADAGLPTYRGVGGLYNGVHTEDGMPIEEVLSGPFFEMRPELTWKYLHQIERIARGAAPSAGHRIVAAMQEVFDEVMVLTQNVDGLHRLAGSRNLIDIHGDFERLFCTACDWSEVVKDYAHLAELPRCPACGAVIRPDVVLFGEMLPPAKLERLEAAQSRPFDVVFSIGTSSLFPYIVAPVLTARRQARPTIEVNPEETDISPVVDLRFRTTASAALGAIWEAFRGAGR